MAHTSNVFIDKGTFNSSQGDIHIHNGNPEFGMTISGSFRQASLSMVREGLQKLELGVSFGAIHDSAERSPPPNCHPGTRNAVRKIILNWIHSDSWDSSFFWLYGPAGAGKTAILQAIAEFLCDQSGFKENFGGSFFFSRGKTGRDKGHFLFSTIAYQLALNDATGLRQHVNRIMVLNPTIHTKSMDVQVQTLIIDAFKCLLPRPRHSYLVIIDGLDECHDKATQQSILRLLCEMITVHKLPLRFLIGSRPESHIRSSLDQESLYTITHRVVLDETFNPGEDIQVFLKDGFAKICTENSILSRSWPGKGIIDLLVQRSSGQFIYAATVLKFVRAEFCSPTKQLALVLKPDPMAFSDLDQLYTQILSVYPSTVNIVHVLGIVSASHGDLAEVVEDIFGMEEGEVKLVLRGLLSLLKDENVENGRLIPYVIPHFAHASFSDYLFDSSRSGPFHVNQQDYKNQVIIRSFALILHLIRSWRMSSITLVLHATTWHYFISRLPISFSYSPKVVKEVIMTDINDLVQEFRKPSSIQVQVVGESFLAINRLFKILQRCYDILKPKPTQLDLHGTAKLEILVDGYRKMLDQLLSTSKDLGDMLRFLPGVVVQEEMSTHGMADLYRIKPDLLERLIKFTTEPLKPSPSDYKLDNHLRGFLQDRDRSQLSYCDPMIQHISICRHFLSLLEATNSFDLQSLELSEYVDFHFYDHLCAATTVFLYAQNISDDHPAVEILHDLETKAYFVDENLSDDILRLAQCIIRGILRWANMLNCRLKGVAVFVSNVNLMERVCHLTNKIYREMLCIRRYERMTYITMGGLDHFQVSAFSWTTQYTIIVSWDLLSWISEEAWGGIPFSFTNFITVQEFSGPLYISPDIYHTQITEYSLETIYRTGSHFPSSPFYLYHGFLFSDWSFREHLSRALPTAIIFYLLRSIRSERLIPGNSTELMIDMLEIIIKWLQGLDSEQPSDLYNRFQDELLQHKKRLSPRSSAMTL